MGPRASGRMAAWGSGRSPSCRILTRPSPRPSAPSPMPARSRAHR